MARITVKGIPHDLEVEAKAPLLPMLREQLGLTGADAVTQKPAPEGAPSGQADCRISGMLHG